jgi:hypothetical protein
MSDIRTEIYGPTATQSIDLNSSAVRTLAGVPTGQISMSDCKGKTWDPNNDHLCVTTDSFLPGNIIARNIKIGDYLVIADPELLTESKGLVTRADISIQPVVRVVTSAGVTLKCTKSAPIGISGGGSVTAKDCFGSIIPIKIGSKWSSSKVISVEELGDQEIIHITCENTFFLAGENDGMYMLHHNLKPLDGP